LAQYCARDHLAPCLRSLVVALFGRYRSADHRRRRRRSSAAVCDSGCSHGNHSSHPNRTNHTVTALLVSNAVLWILVIGLAIVIIALVRQIGLLHERIAPVGALMLAKGL